MGGSWQLPVACGLMEKDFLKEIQEDETYSELNFLREYASRWAGVFDGSFFSTDEIDRIRTIKHPTLTSTLKKHPDLKKYDEYYMLSMDVGRLNDRSVVCVFKVSPNAGGTSDKTLVYIEQYDQTHFEVQAYKVKELIEKYHAQVLVVDANGIGAGLVDYLVKPTKNLDGSIIYPPYEVVNDPRYDQYKTDDSIPMIYNVKATPELNNAMAVNTLTQISAKKVRLLVDEKIAKQQLLEDNRGTTMSSVERAKKLRPHVLTSELKEEMLNLRRKTNNLMSSLVALEQANRKIHKDKYSAFSYGLYWIKLQDDKRCKYKKSAKFQTAMLYSSNSRWGGNNNRR